MTNFKVKMTLTCPSNWTEAECRAFLERIASTKEEKTSIEIEQVRD